MRVHVVATSETTRDYILDSCSSQGVPIPITAPSQRNGSALSLVASTLSCWDLRTGTRTEILAVSFLSSACTFLLLVEFGIPQFLVLSSARPLYVLAGSGAAYHFWRLALLCHSGDWFVE
jgi:hypothetical protein